jgi:hypothetical protein
VGGSWNREQGQAVGALADAIQFRSLIVEITAW